MDETTLHRNARVRVGVELSPRCRGGAAQVRAVGSPRLLRLPCDPACPGGEPRYVLRQLFSADFPVTLGMRACCYPPVLDRCEWRNDDE